MELGSHTLLKPGRAIIQKERNLVGLTMNSGVKRWRTKALETEFPEWS